MIDMNEHDDPQRTILPEDRIIAASVGIFPDALIALRRKRAQEAYDAAMADTESLPPVVKGGQGREDMPMARLNFELAVFAVVYLGLCCLIVYALVNIFTK